jgi:hypothetical protein
MGLIRGELKGKIYGVKGAGKHYQLRCITTSCRKTGHMKVSFT